MCVDADSSLFSFLAASWMIGPSHVALDALLIHLSFLTFIYPFCTIYHTNDKDTDVYVALLFMSCNSYASSCCTLKSSLTELWPSDSPFSGGQRRFSNAASVASA